jgi:FtsH-binding integral membrane protein
MDTIRHDELTRSTASTYLGQVYQWMTAGLLVTAGMSWYVSNSAELMLAIDGSRLGFIVVLAALFILPLALPPMLPRLSATAATLWFLAYSAVVGLAFAPLRLVYTDASIVNAFIVTAGTFAGMSVYGLVTKRDLTAMGSFLSMGLWGIILAMIVNIFLKSPGVNFAISILGVIIFTGLTAYDTQRIRNFGENAPVGDAAAMRRGVILGSLTLYLDFINLFLMLLRLMGDRR